MLLLLQSTLQESMLKRNRPAIYTCNHNLFRILLILLIIGIYLLQARFNIGQ